MTGLVDAPIAKFVEHAQFKSTFAVEMYEIRAIMNNFGLNHLIF